MFWDMFKNTYVDHAGEKVDLAPIARDAIRRLGLFKPKQSRWLAAMVAKDFNKGSRAIASAMRKRGRAMAIEERKAAGLGRAMMGDDLWSRLNPNDRDNVADRLVLIINRICIHAYRQGKYKQMEREGGPGYGVHSDEIVIENPGDLHPPCHAVKKRWLGRTVRFRKCPQLPLRRCDAAICHCNITPAWLVGSGSRRVRKRR
ncbi:MAG: hypothetical protein OXR62_10800 [Ahrensia sp.]|nr:hypothetical protein [Ahrensia sp.]